MFDIFGIKARKLARKKAQEEKEKKELEEIAAKKAIYRERKEKIKKYIDDYNKKESERCDNLYAKLLSQANEENSKCPKCGSTKVINKIARTTGSIHGEGNSNSFTHVGGGIFTSSFCSSSHGHSELNGEMDTLPVNKCTECGHEWMIKEIEYPTYTNIFSTIECYAPGYLFRRIEEYLGLKYDPYDITSKYNSLEEMQEELFKRVSNSCWIDKYAEFPRYMIEYLIYEGFSEHYWYIEDMDKKAFNYHKGDDCYSYTMTDEMWELVKKMISWKGTEE